jgi:hypothetical protein
MTFVDKLWAGLCIALAFVIVAVILILVLGVSGCEAKMLDQWDIYSIERETSLSGSFFLGTGSIDSVEYFFTWQDRGDGGMILVKIRRTEAVIFESDEKPHLERWREENGYGVYRFYVPKGTVLREFKL